MPRICTVCASPDRGPIELGLARKVTLRALAAKFGISIHILSRHRLKHMPAGLKAALRTVNRPTKIDLEALRKNMSEGLLQHVASQMGRLYHLHDRALKFDDIKTGAMIEGRITDNLTLAAKLLGEINVAARHVTNNILISPEYGELRVALVHALRPYPDAARAVSDVMRQVEKRHRVDPPPMIEGTVNADPR